MQPNTLTRGKHKCKIYIENIKKIHGGSKTGSGTN